MTEYQPIENYGIIGDLNTVALVGLNGSIDLMCFPYFDSPSIFASLLDKNKGGHYQITPIFGEMRHRQMYLPDTNVLLTRFLSAEGVGEITDFMPVEESFGGKELIRRVTSVRGAITYRMQCRPHFNYARDHHTVEQQDDHELIFRSEGEVKLCMRLKSTVPLQHENGGVTAEFTLNPGETADFLLEHIDKDYSKECDLKAFVTKSLFNTVNYWKNWVSKSRYKGRWYDMVTRSALVLKLLTSCKYGSIVAAPTFGIPEHVGGARNWDYRYTWIRDASFTIYALLKLGYKREAGDFINWVDKRCQGVDEAGYLGLMYTLAGKVKMVETTLDHLEGYKNSKPVRIGNDAHGQLQLDIYGELMDSVFLYNKYGELISHDLWNRLTVQIEWISKNWNQKDEGIWEVRGGRRFFLHSRLMCWVALDRAIKLATDRSFPIPGHWKKERDIIYESIFKDFWNEEIQAFVQHKGANYVDASTLLMPLLKFISPRDPRWLSTLNRIEKELVSDSLVYRYLPNKAASDGFVSHEGTFSLCTFWYVECLSRSGQLQKARFYFEKMLGYANQVGLYSEQLGFQGEHLGNFPQAFTHIGLIAAAMNLEKQLNDQRNREVAEEEEYLMNIPVSPFKKTKNESHRN